MLEVLHACRDFSSSEQSEQSERKAIANKVCPQKRKGMDIFTTVGSI
jgi:hypothetical protein